MLTSTWASLVTDKEQPVSQAAMGQLEGREGGGGAGGTGSVLSVDVWESDCECGLEEWPEY
jgi:hypothetical protein